METGAHTLRIWSLFLEEVLKVHSLGSDHLFLIEGRPPCKHSIRKPWVQAVQEIGLEPAPHFHDLRHAWKTNARRSGMTQRYENPLWATGIVGAA